LLSRFLLSEYRSRIIATIEIAAVSPRPKRCGPRVHPRILNTTISSADLTVSLTALVDVPTHAVGRPRKPAKVRSTFCNITSILIDMDCFRAVGKPELASALTSGVDVCYFPISG
jgi:hypothetical protein